MNGEAVESPSVLFLEPICHLDHSDVVLGGQSDRPARVVLMFCVRTAAAKFEIVVAIAIDCFLGEALEHHTGLCDLGWVSGCCEAKHVFEICVSAPIMNRPTISIKLG